MGYFDNNGTDVITKTLFNEMNTKSVSLTSWNVLRRNSLLSPMRPYLSFCTYNKANKLSSFSLISDNSQNKNILSFILLTLAYLAQRIHWRVFENNFIHCFDVSLLKQAPSWNHLFYSIFQYWLVEIKILMQTVPTHCLIESNVIWTFLPWSKDENH